MASSEGQTELLTGWSCIVHQPSEDPEPSELPSTVDITAFSAGLNIEPSTNTQTEECSESGSESESGSNNSGSDGSGSCSVSDSSDSDSSSSSSSSRSSSPEFSVTSSQTNGLRLKIATVRKSCGSPAVTEKEKPATKAPPPEKPVAKPCNLSSSSESGDSDSESDSNETESSDGKESAKQEKVKEVPVNKKVGKIKGKAASVEKKVVEKKTQQKKEVVSPKNVRKTRSKRKKMASLPISRSSMSSSSDSDESDADSAMLASCSLQEIRQEDLAAILPDQQECDAFGAFEEAERNSPQTGDASGSDIELPQQAVNALIQRTTESSSESESHPPPNPNSLYANSLLQQFVAQTQMINTTSGTSVNDAQAETTHDVKKNNETEIKRKRGRPKKLLKTQKIVEKNEYCADPNVSPDSGIQNSPDHTSSPDCSPRPINKSESQKRLNRNNKNSAEVKQSKHIVTSNRFDRILYGNTDRVLYPPRRKVGRPALVKKGPGRPPKISKSDNKTSKKQSELKEGAKIESVKENGRTSQVKENSKSPLVKESTAKTLITKEHTKVEKKEYSKDKKDNSKLDRKENSKTIISKSSSVKENLRVQSKENGKASVARTKHSNTEPKEKLNGNTKESKTTKSSHLHEICERVSKRLETTSTEKSEKEPETKEKEAKQKQVKCSNRAILTSKNKIDKSKNKYLMLKNAKLMHSKHKHKKHKKCKFKILKPLSAAVSDPKLNTEIEKLVQDFVKLCCISSSKPAKENVPEILKALKKVSKKRKTSEYGDRKKKKQNTTNAVEKGATSNEQRLPLKKRHYHLSASNNESKEDTLKVNEVSEDAKTKQKIIVEETFDVKSKKSLQEPVENKAKQKTLAKLDEHSDTKTKKSVNKIEDLIDVKNKLKTEKVEENDGKQKRESFVNSKTTLQKDQDDPIDCKHRQKNIVTNKVVKSEKIEALNKTPINKQNDTISSKFSGINNNEYEIKAHIDEAIEACISKYNGKQKMKALEIKVETLEDHERNQKVSPNLTSPKKKGCEAIKIEAIDTQKNILTTTPKKRHRLEMANLAPPEKLVDEIKIEPSIENVVSEIRMRRNLNSVVKKIETSATHVNTRQKNRLDDITSNLSENAAQMNTRQKNRLDEASSNLIENGAQMNTRQKNRLDEATPTLTENNVQINTRQKNRLDEATPTLTENNVQINTRQKNRLDETTPTLTENNVQINTRQKNRLDEATPTLTENNVQINTRQKNRLDEATPTLTENNVQINTRQKNRLDEATPTLTENNVQINTRKKNRLDEATSTLTENNVLINTRQKNRLDDITSISTESGGQMNTRQKYRHDHVTSNLTENSVQMNTRQKNRSDDIISSLTENTAQMNTRQKNRLEDITSNLTENAAQMNTRQKSRQDETILTENVVQMNTRQKNRLDENTVNLNTRKKNRLEDLASNLVSKISENSEIQNASKQKKEDRATVIKYPASKNTTELDNNVQKNVDDNKILKKVKGKTVGEGEKMLTQETVKNDLATVEKKCDDKLGELATPPAGVFTPTVDLESHLIKKEKLEAKIEDKPKSTVRIENRKKIKKRRAINRTGFPTIKKKKKKIIPPPLPEPTIEEIKPSPCERVPKDGEEYSSFVERTEKTSPWPKKPTSNFIERVEIDEKKPPPSPTNKTNIDKVNEAEEVKTKDKSSDDEEDAELINVGKWEVLSECDSLPLEDRIDYDFSLKRRRDSHSSDLDDLTLEARLQRLKKTHKIKRKRETLERKCNTENAAKKRLRDISPASSIEPYTEKRLLREDRASASSDESRKTKKTPRWRKKYLIAGLFSDYYKEGDEAVKQKRTELAMKTSKITYHPHEHPYGLLPAPYHCGKYLRCRKIPFQLPYDLWWQHTHSQLPGRDIVPSWNYRKIRTNVYNVKNTTGACEPQACNCSSQSGCGDDCINRLVLAECPASHKCKNQKIQRHDWSPGIEKFMTEYKGWGVKTNLPIKNGDFILEYVGEVVSDQEFKERMATRYIHDTHHYCLHLDGGLVIDGHRMGGDGRFVNHSCAPNCEMQKWSVNGQFRMALFALRDIKAGEELTYDYNFSLFNPADGQECRCDSDNCRGVIGGKSQRIKPALPVAPSQPGRVGRPRKNQAKKALNEKKEIPAPSVSVAPSVANSVNMKPISHAQRLFILEHHCFLIRNLKKVKKVRERSSSSASVLRNQAPTPTNQSTFFNNLNALRQPRNMKTRRVALVDENPELKKSVQLANVLRDIFNAVTESKDENNEKLCTPFMYCPSKRKLPDYYTKVADPIDFTTIEQNIDSGVYKTVETFDADMNKLFDNSIKFYGRSTELGISAVRLKKIYSDVKKESMPKFENVLGVKPPAKFISNKKKGEEEDIIRCICGMYRDEGLMIQCERCLVWQHCECVRADENAPSYHCENCVPRKVDYEISLDEYTEHGHQYYMTLLRGDLQLRQGDTVYVLRDIPIPGTDKKHTYDTIGEIKYTDLDIFRIERLWKDCKNGQRFAYGHHYLRPHETYHEPTRKFFPNEVMRVPLYEAVPVELIISHCWVMDLNTFCKGRPIGAPEDHIYICEYRVDKSARLFSKVSKSKFPICTKTYAFERFDVRLKVSRTYTPHDLDPAFVKQRGRKPQETECSKESIPVQPVNNVPVIRTPVDQKARLNTILLKLISKMPTKQVIDVTYLLEGGRRRKKQT